VHIRCGGFPPDPDSPRPLLEARAALNPQPLPPGVKE
jgi:hypothetical protein